MEENRIRLDAKKKEARLLPMQGMDSAGNLYEVDNISLLKNKRRFLPVMGEFHFSRYEPEAWEEELLKMRAGGVNILATYVFWIHHEEREGEWNFSGCRNLRAFLETCGKVGMPVWLRIGPWAHGECRNGGFPDWLVKDEKLQVRTDDPAYLEKVRRFWGKLGEQAEGMMCKDGGPVLGIQLENEYGHCGGPSDREEGMAHLRTLKRMAQEAGFVVPYYTATGWGGAYVVDGETLPVLGGYVDAPWAEHVEAMPASANFIFTSFKQDENIGSDLGAGKDQAFTFDMQSNPYLTAELGGGLQVTSHRRTWPSPGDIEAQSLCMLGGGANLLGYYMYHGGINPDGKYSTLQESRDTGYNNDLPVKSYDFQTCIRQSGQLGASYGRLKKLHLMLEDFGEILAGAQTFFPDILPDSPEDMQTLRVTARVNPDTGAGFLFLNNHQRMRRMAEHRNVSVKLYEEKGQMELEDLCLKDGECAVIPFRFPVGEGENRRVLESTNASLLCRLKNRLFLYTDEKAVVRWKGEAGEVTILTTSQANRAFKIGERLYLTEHEDSCLICQEGQVWLLTKDVKERPVAYEADGSVRRLNARAACPNASAREQGNRNGADTKGAVQAVTVPAWARLVHASWEEGGTLAYLEYRVEIGQVPEEALHQLYLEVDYAGDRAEVWSDGKLLDDWFSTGEIWCLNLRRFGYPSGLTLRIYPSDKPIPNPYGNQVYYDLPSEKGCALCGVRTVAEYRLLVER